MGPWNLKRDRNEGGREGDVKGFAGEEVVNKQKTHHLEKTSLVVAFKGTTQASGFSVFLTLDAAASLFPNCLVLLVCVPHACCEGTSARDQVNFQEARRESA